VGIATQAQVAEQQPHQLTAAPAPKQPIEQRVAKVQAQWPRQIENFRERTPSRRPDLAPGKAALQRKPLEDLVAQPTLAAEKDDAARVNRVRAHLAAGLPLHFIRPFRRGVT